MALIFTKNYLDTDLLSTGNAWVVQFESDTVETPTRATVEFLGETFSIDPDPNGKFRFDFQRSVNSKVNTNDFNDPLNSVDISGGTFIYNEAGSYLSIDVDYTIEFEVAGDETSSNSYRFLKAVYDTLQFQLGKQSIVNDLSVLLPQTDGEYYARTTSTQPFDLSIYSKVANASLLVYNTTTGEDLNWSVTEGVNRVFFQDGLGNEMPTITLQDGWNRIQVFPINGNQSVFEIINIHKEAEDCLTVLKWLNLEGGYAYFPFVHETQDFAGSTKDFIENDYETFDDYEANLVSTGTDLVQQLEHTAIRIKSNEAKGLKGLIASPKVYQLFFKEDDTPLWKERVFKKGELRLKQTGKNVFDFQIKTFQKENGYTL